MRETFDESRKYMNGENKKDDRLLDLRVADHIIRMTELNKFSFFFVEKIVKFQRAQ